MEKSPTYTGKNHFIIVGWNERVRSILAHFSDSSVPNKIVLIDSTLNVNPMLSEYIYFIKGNPTHSQTLVKANIKHATKILVTADPHRPEEQADMHSLLTLLTIKGQNPSIYSIVEILTSEQVVNAKHLRADKIIQRNQSIGRLMYDRLFDKRKTC
ncbi:voltage-gated potassium channel [Bacillus fengqiuensis]|nr:voltage-gated potassium channel [Bacillus fengqiuensis]